MTFGSLFRLAADVPGGIRLPLRRVVLGCAVALACAAPLPVAAQVRPSQPPRDTVPAAPPRDTIPRDTVPAASPRDTVPAALRADTAARAGAVPADTVRGVTPKGAFFRSLVLPGWGQSAVGSPGRGAIYFAMEAGSLWMVYKSRQKLHDARENQDFLRLTGELEEDEQSGLVNSREEQLEDWLTLSGFLLLFNAADAFVAAHLVDFDERIGVVPSPRGGADIGVSIPVGRRP